MLKLYVDVPSDCVVPCRPGRAGRLAGLKLSVAATAGNTECKVDLDNKTHPSQLLRLQGHLHIANAKVEIEHHVTYISTLFLYLPKNITSVSKCKPFEKPKLALLSKRACIFKRR
jgi:hypothetical protein